MNQTLILPDGIHSIMIRDSFFNPRLSPESTFDKLEALYEYLIQPRFSDHGIKANAIGTTRIDITGLENQPPEVMKVLAEVFINTELASFTWNDTNDKPYTYELSVLT